MGKEDTERRNGETDGILRRRGVQMRAEPGELASSFLGALGLRRAVADRLRVKGRHRWRRGSSSAIDDEAERRRRKIVLLEEEHANTIGEPCLLGLGDRAPLS